MYLKKSTINCTKEYLKQIENIKHKIAEADAIVVGAGAGLSTSAGLTYSGERFNKYFGDFEKKYGFHDMYSGSFYSFPSLEIFWAFWSRNIYYNRYDQSPGEPFLDLLKIVSKKDYFVITTNVDHQFQRAGFDKDRLFYSQGDYGLWQCSVPCHKKTYDNENTVRAMLSEQKNMGKRILFLELGVGWNTPFIIKYPFWEMTAYNPHATYISINTEKMKCPDEIEQQSIFVNADIG